MMQATNTSTFISRLAISLLLCCLALTSASARKVQLRRLAFFEPDTVPVLRGFAVSFDLAGAALMSLSDWGQYEGALRVNLQDKYFPIVELGYGKASHEDDVVTGITYRTKAPYGRIGMDFNLLKDKHQPNRLYAGFRYAFTSYKVDLERQNFPDPVWLWETGYGVRAEQCNQHWLEVVFGVDAQVVGPVHLGWSVRYKRRMAGNDGVMEKTWYVPGFGTYGSTRLGGTFNVIIDI